MKTLLMTVASLAVVASPLAASAQQYGHDGGGWGGRGVQGATSDRRDQRGYDGRDNHRDYGRNSGAYRHDDSSAIFAGIAGLIVGSALAGSQSHGYGQPYDYGQSYGYSRAYAYAPDYAQRCGWQTEAYRSDYGGVEYRQVQVCR